MVSQSEWDKRKRLALHLHHQKQREQNQLQRWHFTVYNIALHRALREDVRRVVGVARKLASYALRLSFNHKHTNTHTHTHKVSNPCQSSRCLKLSDDSLSYTRALGSSEPSRSFIRETSEQTDKRQKTYNKRARYSYSGIKKKWRHEVLHYWPVIQYYDIPSPIRRNIQKTIKNKTYMIHTCTNV